MSDRSILDSGSLNSGPLRSGPLDACWFCRAATENVCECGRIYCDEHGYVTHCLVCALARGMFEQAGRDEPLSGLILLSLRAWAEDPYIVIPSALRGLKPLPLSNVERLVLTLIKMVGGQEDGVRLRAATALAGTTLSWPTMNPSPLVERSHGISLLATDQVRRALTQTLRLSRPIRYEAMSLAILDKLRMADFNDLYPSIRGSLKVLVSSTVGTRVREVFDALTEFYPTHSDLVNEKCELMVYEQYANPARGATTSLERIHGPLMKYSPTLGKLLKKGTWLSSQARYADWYRGEPEPR